MLATPHSTSSIPASFLPQGHNLPIGDFGLFLKTVCFVGERAAVPASVQATTHILVVEENKPLARLLAKGLGSERIAVDVVDGYGDIEDLLDQRNYSVVVLGMDVSSETGMGMLQMVRAKLPSAGILALTGNGSKQAMVATLDHGADDYLAKPFSLLELMARVRALHRRAGSTIKAAAKPLALVLNREEFSVERCGRRIELTPREFALLEFLVENPGKALSRSTLMQAVWKMSDEAGSNTNIVDVYMKYLRDKLDGDGEESLIRTVRGIGYVLNQVN